MEEELIGPDVTAPRAVTLLSSVSSTVVVAAKVVVADAADVCKWILSDEVVVVVVGAALASLFSLSESSPIMEPTMLPVDVEDDIVASCMLSDAAKS